MRYYLLVSLLTGPLFFIAIIPLALKYITLRYRFDEKGISMSWGVLWRREVLLTYRRIQDIHLTRNILQRWMGLATVGVQTASGSTAAEMQIEGILEAEPLRDFLYTRMRGARGLSSEAETDGEKLAPPGTPSDEAIVLLREIRDSLAILAGGTGGPERTDPGG